MAGCYSRGRGIEPGRDRLFSVKINLIFFKKKIPGVFEWFRLHKKVSLTTLEPSGRLSGVRHGHSQAPGGLQNCLLANFGQFRGIWCENTFFTFFWPQKSFVKLFLNSLVVTKNT